MSSRLAAPDTAADLQLREVLSQEPPVGFTVVAGAGSGKTTSLVKALAHVLETRGNELRARTQRVACITYTEVAAQEISNDVDNDPLVVVSTIHSFLWTLVRPFQRDIKLWVEVRLAEKVERLEKERRGLGPKSRESTRTKNAADIERAMRQRDRLGEVERFTYGVGSDYGAGVLGHDDILRMVPQMIMSRPLLAEIVARQFPYIFVDESQDTFVDVVECLKQVSRQASGDVCLGFFGDPMQQIYMHGAGGIVPESEWARIEKPENFRSSPEVLRVINAVRSRGDGLVQTSGRPGRDGFNGTANVFVLPADDHRTANLERVRVWTASKLGTTGGIVSGDEKVLMIVHRMAARRLGFGDLYSAFHDNRATKLADSFDEGTAWPLAPLLDVVEPLCSLGEGQGSHEIAILRRHSPLLHGPFASGQAADALAQARESIAALRSLAADGGAGSIGEMVRWVVDHRLAELDPRMSAYLQPDGQHQDVVLAASTVAVLDAMMACDFAEISGYLTYINQQSPYATHHGTKGSEFGHVLVVLDDEEGRFNLYSYEKLLGLKDLSATDVENLEKSVDSVVDRTLRLFYVCVSRAVDSLGIVLFTKDVARAVDLFGKSPISGGRPIITLDQLGIENESG